MIRKFIFLTLLLGGVSYATATENPCPKPTRSQNAVRSFRKLHPCPSTGLKSGACPGWEVDHIIPLACCGKDDIINMRWLEYDFHKQRHKEGLKCNLYPQPK